MDLRPDPDDPLAPWRASCAPSATEGLLDPQLGVGAATAIDDCAASTLCWQRLQQGLKARDQGQWHLAEAAFSAALRLTLARAPDDSVEVLDLLRHMGATLRARGKWAMARSLHTQVLSACTRLQGSTHVTTLEAEFELAETLFQLGDFTQARSLQEHVLGCRISAVGLDHADAVAAMTALGSTLLYQGHRAQAVELLERALPLARKLHGAEASATLGVEDGLAAALWNLSRLPEARALQEHVVQARRKDGGDLRDVLAAQGNLAATLWAQGELAKARELQQEVIATRLAVFGAGHPDTLSAQNNLAWMMRSAGDLAAARALSERIVAEGRAQLGPAHPISFAAEGLLLLTLQDLDDQPALHRAALEDIDVLPTISASAGRVFARYAMLLRILDGQSASASAEAGTAASIPTWISQLLIGLPAIGQAFRDALELQEDSERQPAMADFKAFHSAWANICARWAPDHLPQALAALHGLESWAALMARLDGLQGSGAGRRHKRLWQARQDLLQLRLRQGALAAVVDGMRAQFVELGTVLQTGIGTSATAQVLDALRTELDALLAQVADLRTEEQLALQRYRVARSDWACAETGIATLVEAPALRGAELAARLGASEALVITWAQPGSGHQVLLIRPGRVDLIKVGDLAGLVDCARAYQVSRRTAHRGSGLRDVALDLRPEVPLAAPITANAPAPGVGDLQRLTTSSFWAPLQGALTAIRRLHLVTGPGHHGLALECATPPALHVCRYFGLPAYLSLRDHSINRPPSESMRVLADPAWSLAPIPFVQTEAAVLRALVAPSSRIRRIDGQQLVNTASRIGCLALFLHGGIAGPRGREHGFLVLDSAQRPPLVLDPPTVNALKGSIAEVYASACMGALVSDSDSGSAMGLCSEWQLRGVRSVVACMAPVEDHFMPLLGGLFWFRRLQGQWPAMALLGAKKDLRSGEWPELLVSILLRAYRRTMRQVLISAARLSCGAPAQLAAQTVAGWLLPPYVRASYFEGGALDSKSHQRFSERYCASRTTREQLISQCLHYLIEERARPEDQAVQPYARAAIDNICAFTCCFGDDGSPLEDA